MSQVTFCDTCDITKEKTETLLKWIEIHKKGYSSGDYGMYEGIALQDLRELKTEISKRIECGKM